MKRISIIILLFCFITVNASEKEIVNFADCVDGDTIKVYIEGNKQSIRLLAVDTPETVKVGTEVEPYGKEASEFTCNKIKEASVIELEYDAGSNKKDKYDRVLAWVYVDGVLLQEMLIKEGYAKVDYIYGDYLYTDKLYELEKEAATNKKGIWSNEEYIFDNEKEETNSIDGDFISMIKDIINDLYKDIKKEIKKYIKKNFYSIFD